MIQTIKIEQYTKTYPNKKKLEQKKCRTSSNIPTHLKLLSKQKLFNTNLQTTIFYRQNFLNFYFKFPPEMVSDETKVKVTMIVG